MSKLQRKPEDQATLDHHAEVVAFLEKLAKDPSWRPTVEDLDRVLLRGRRPLTQEMIDEARRRDR